MYGVVLLQQHFMVNHVVPYHHMVGLRTHTRPHVVLELWLLLYLLLVDLVLMVVFFVDTWYVVVGLLLFHLLLLGLVAAHILLYVEFEGYQYQLNTVRRHIDYILNLLLA